MGYATTDIDPKTAYGICLAHRYRVTEASKENYFYGSRWSGKAVSAEESDHKPPRYIFRLDNGDFVKMETTNY